MRRLLWLPVVAVLMLVARWLCYALAAPSPLSGKLEASAGGPRLVVVTLVSVALAAGLSVFAVWLAALGVRERARLRPERVAPSLRLRRLVAELPQVALPFPEAPVSRPALLCARPRGPPLPA